ncbi:DUF6745 domain-containing protein [Lentzea sp. NPDC051213]|uniref:DUF6745 domain-containing protein n=1 Tax=Lentzea sp. NPDC051213 TaxID=3364126 RepID=UPI0037BA5311
MAQLYAATGRPPPRFVWVRSPAEATKVLPAKEVVRFDGDWQSVEARIAALASDLRYELRQRTGWQGQAQRARVRESLVSLVKSTMPVSLGLGWCGQHDTDLWQTLARSTGWWWPREDVCVMAERPVAMHVDEDSLPHNDNGPAIAFADGSCAYAWHGTPLTPIASAHDPANPGFHLTLHDLPERARLLVVVNGSVERDGTRRRYGLRVPQWFRHPVEAAAWTYGLEPDQYLQLLRRT